MTAAFFFIGAAPSSVNIIPAITPPPQSLRLKVSFPSPAHLQHLSLFHLFTHLII